MTKPTHHATRSIERKLAASPERVFAAFSDPAARAVWSPPSPDLNMHYTEADFRVGGRDVWTCGPGPAEGTTVETTYHAIRPNRLILSTEAIGDGTQAMAVALVTVELADAAGACAVTVTLQAVDLAAMEDMDMIGEMEVGWAAALENLSLYLAA